MKQDLINRRSEAEGAFNDIKTSFDSIMAELGKYKAESISDLETEMHRLQGEFRVLNELIDKTPEDPVQPSEAEIVSTKADKIDATKVKGA